MKSLGDRRARSAFSAQRTNARLRGVEWELTFEQWMEVWKASGHWENRGRTKGGYVMSGPRDCGPYAVGNVRIVTHSQNALEAQSHAVPRAGVRCQLPGNDKPWAAAYKKKHIGYFATEAEARAARDAAMLIDPPSLNKFPPNKGRPLTEQHKASLRAAHRGHPISEEAKKKISEAMKAAHARRRGVLQT